MRGTAWVAGFGVATPLAWSSVASAHPGHAALDMGLGAGFAHPFSGGDHLLAAVAVALWAATVGGAALWALTRDR